MENAEKILLAIHYEWCENWDVIQEFLGKEITEAIDKEIPYLIEKENEGIC
jgi:hypothetical protein